MGHRLKFAWLLLCLITCAYTKEISYSDLNQFIATNNDLSSAFEFETQAQRELTGHLKRSFIPDIQLDLGYESYRAEGDLFDTSLSSVFWKAEVEWNIFRAGRDSLKDQELKSQVDRSILHQQSFQSQALFQAQILYWNIAIQKSKNDFLAKHLIDVQAYRDEVNRRLKNKILREADLIRADFFILEIKNLIDKVQLEKDEMTNRLALLIGIDDHKSLTLLDPLPSQYPDPVFKVDPEMKPLPMKALESEMKILGLRELQAKRHLWPEFNFFAFHRDPRSSEEFEIAQRGALETGVGLRLEWSLGELKNAQSQASSFSALKQSKQYKLSYQQKETQALLHEIEHDLQMLSRLIRRQSQQMDLLLKAHRLMQNDFKAGVRSHEEILQSLESRLALEEQMFDHRLKYLSQEAKLHWLQR